jgi:hypothetical protein
MSGELEIDHGGAIAVDTEQLRAVGARVAALATPFDEARAAIRRALDLIICDLLLGDEANTDALGNAAARIEAMRIDAEDAAVKTLLMADAFEVVELRAQAEALRLTDAAAAGALLARVDQMLSADERIRPMVADLTMEWMMERFEGLGNQWNLNGSLPPVFLLGAFVGVLARVGVVHPGMTLTGPAEAVTLESVRSSTPSTGPTSLRGTLGRMPKDPRAQIAVEKLTFADGSTRYMVYLKGTQSVLPQLDRGTEPWDMKSNLQLYSGQKSASYQAVRDALTAAGAGAGDAVGVVAHSQSGMIAAHLAVESEFDVDFIAAAGSPKMPMLGDDRLLVQLTHTDDVITSLAGWGSPVGSGSPDSFVATRVGDPDAGLQDLALAPHSWEAYLETASMIDESDDPRAVALRAQLAKLGEAVAVERTEYHAERVSPCAASCSADEG